MPTTTPSDLEQTIELPAFVYQTIKGSLRGADIHQSSGIGSISGHTEHFCLWTAFHQKRLIFVPAPEE